MNEHEKKVDEFVEYDQKLSGLQLSALGRPPSGASYPLKRQRSRAYAYHPSFHQNAQISRLILHLYR